MLNNKSKIIKMAYISLSLCFFASCQNKEKVDEKQQGMQQVPVAVPGAGNAWKAVKLLIQNKTNPNDNGKDLEVEIGGNPVMIPNSKLKIKVEEFLPDFFIDGQKMASKSTELNNPAVSIIVEEEGRPPYRGWLFANYPDVHEFPHETISIRLKDYIKK